MVKINLTLTAQKTIFETERFQEFINVEYLQKLLKTNLIKDTEDWNETKQLNKLLSRVNKNNLDVVYKRNDKMDFGRVYPLMNLSNSMLRREIRHTLQKQNNGNDYYYDIDIVNCHYVILSNICNHNKIPCKQINKYVNNRDEYMKDIMTTYKISKEETKILFISLLYGSNINNFFKKEIDKEIKSEEHNIINKIQQDLLLKKTSKKLIKLYEEIQDISKIIAENNNEIKYQVERNKIIKNQSNYNLNASILSTYLQEYELRILENVYLYFREIGVIKNNSCVLCFDGLMIDKEELDFYEKECYYSEDNNILNKLSKYIKDKTGFNLNFSIKNFDNHYLESLEDKKYNEETLNKNSYEYKKIKFEENNFKILCPVSYCNIRNGEIYKYNRSEFANLHENYRYIKKKLTKDGIQEIETDFINTYLKDENIRTYDKLVHRFDKTKVSKNDYNEFNHFEAENKINDNIPDFTKSLIYQHLFNLCGKDNDTFDYVLKYFANMVQFPENPPQIMLIFYSLAGAGKDTFFNYFKNNILGKKYVYQSSKLKDIFGTFNGHLKKKILTILSELDNKDSDDFIQIMKDKIGGDTNNIEGKGINQEEQINTIRYIALTNEKNAIKIRQQDRKFVLIACDNSNCKNENYFKPLRDEMDTGIYDYSFYKYLMDIEITKNYDFTGKRPITSIYDEIILLNRPPIIDFLEDLIIYNNNQEEEEKQIQLKMTSEEFTSSVNLYLSKNNFKTCYTTKKLIYVIENLNLTSIIRYRTNKGMINIIKYNELYEELVNKKLMKPF